MALLKHRNTTPPDGFRYIQFETKLWIEGETLTQLVEKVIEHRAYRGLQPIDQTSVQLEVERQICNSLSEKHCRAEPGEDYRPLKDQSRSLSLEKVVNFSSALLELARSGVEFVSRDEAKRRADICRGCQFNKVSSSCSCTPFYKSIDALTPIDRKEPGLNVCTICGCSLQLKVIMTEKVIRSSIEKSDLAFPDFCWQRTYLVPHGPDQEA